MALLFLEYSELALPQGLCLAPSFISFRPLLRDTYLP